MKFPLSFYKLVMAAAVALPAMAFATITPEAPTLDNTDNCYMIGSAAELYGFAEMVNGTGGGFNGCGKLTADIVVNENVLTSATGTSNVNAETGEYTGTEPAHIWTPIGTKGSGTSSKPFKGEFHGNGHTISGLYVNPQEQINSSYKGLFGYVGGEVVIDGVGIVDSYISGFNYVGGLVGGLAEGTPLTISNSFNAGFVVGNMGIGGLVGGLQMPLSVNNPTTVKINNSYNLGRVAGNTSSIGGLVGYADALAINNSYNMGLVSARKGSGDGLVGNYYPLLASTVANSFYIGESQFEGNGATKKTASEFANGIVAKAMHDWCEMDGDNCKVGGLDGTVWGQDLSKENSLPEFIERLDYRLGSVTFFEKAGKIDSAYVDATSDLAVDFPNDVVVSGPIKFKRTFAGDGYSTIVLPFTPNFESEKDFVSGVNFYAFYYYDFVNQKIQISDVCQDELVANVPYLVKAAGATELVFKNGGTFNTAGGARSVNLGGMGAGWTIAGTYAYKKWEEGDEGLGKTYGFVGAGDNEASEVGKFKKAGAGAYIYPMRAYLEYVAPALAGRPAANGAVRAFAANTVASLPDEIDVMIVEKGETGTEIAGSDDASGEQTTRVVGTINMRTGEFKFANDRWFDLNGRYLGNKKPTQKGAYYNNGKKVIVK